MQKSFFLILGLLCIAAAITAGCTSTSTAPAAATITAVPQVTTTTAGVTATIPAAVTTTTQISVPATTSASDPIEHRYIRSFRDPSSSLWIGYEYRFYPGGVLRYRDGLTKTTSSNIVIDQINHEGSGTWTNLGNNKYLLKYLLKDDPNTAQTIEEYTLVPAHEEVDYPGVVIAEHIESQAELDAINKGEQRRGDYMYFPERAKID